MDAMERARERWDRSGRPGDPPASLLSTVTVPVICDRDDRDKLSAIADKLAQQRDFESATFLWSLVSRWDLADAMQETIGGIA